MSPPGPADIAAQRSRARGAVARSLQDMSGPGQVYRSAHALGFLRWEGQDWVTPFGDVGDAIAYFARADEIGIDYDYGAVFDASDPAHPVLSWERLGSGAPAAVGAETSTSPADRLRRLRALIELHDAFWAHLARASDPQLAARMIPWMAQWSPWIARWRDLDWSGITGEFDVAQELSREAAAGLTWWREAAVARGIPIPDLGTARRGFIRPGWDSQSDPGYQSGIRTQGEYMHDLIGRGHGGGGHGGGGGGGGHRGHGGGRRPGLRRTSGSGWGGWWPSWPIAYYAPQYAGDEEESVEDEVISGRGRRGGQRRSGRRRRNDQQQQMLDQGPYDQGPYGPGPGGGVLRVDPGESDESDVHEQPRRREAAVMSGNELFSLLPVLAPGASGLSCQMNLGPDLQLRVSICVDGRCYEGAADLSDVLGNIAQGVSDQHAGAHGGPTPVTPEAIEDVHAHADRAAQHVGMELVGALYDQHVNAVASGWFDSLRHGVLSVYRAANSPVTWLNKNIAKNLKKLEPAVTVAATAVATAYGGPAAGAAASRLTGPVLDMTARTGGDPTRLFSDLKQHAGGDPAVDHAVDAARQAVAQTTAAYHLTATAADAAGGDASAAGKIAQLETAASGGDPAAITAMRIIGEAFNTLAQNRAARGGASSAATTSGAERARGKGGAMASRRAALRREGAAAAVATRDAAGTQILGYARYSSSDVRRGESGSAIIIDDTVLIAPFDSLDQADDWFGGLDAREIEYAAYYDAGDPTWPASMNEKFGVPRGASHVVSGAIGILPWLALGAAGGGAYAWWHHHRAAQAAAQAAQAAAPATQSGALGILPWIALAAAGGAGWTGHAWWQQHQARLAAAHVPPHAPPPLPPPPVPTPAPVSASGWW